MLNLFLVLSFLTLLYSYGFVDLNLSLCSHSFCTRFIHTLQLIPYFNRPLSLKIFLFLILSLFLLYFWLVFKTQFTTFPYRSIIFIALIFTFAYPFLSHDVFKYLFAAKLVLKYHLNPHLTSPNAVIDPWLRFMRWIHTPSPYGPVFTLITLPAYLLGLGKFVPSLFIFKLLNFAWYCFSIYLIGRLSLLLNQSSSQKITNQLFFALNPLILIEGLSNAHNDIPMLALFLLSFYFFLRHKRFLSFLTMLLSVGVKYITLAFLPIYFLPSKFQTRPFLILKFLTLIFFLVPIAYYSQYQPWYIIWTLTLISLLPSLFLKQASLFYALGGLLRYLPFINTGLWSATLFQFNLLTFTPLVLYLVFTLLKSKQV